MSGERVMGEPWRNRIVGYGEEAPDQLLAHPGNWRTHPKSQQDALAGVLSDVGVVQNILVNRRSGRLIDGHLRVALALRSDQPAVPVTYVDLSDEEEALILATIDPIAAMAGADAEKLDALLAEVNTDDAAVRALLDEMRAAHGIAPGAGVGLGDPNEVPDPPAEPTTKPGDLWLLGGHRLLCGDSTYPDTVNRALDGAKVDMVFTDPPYGVNVSGKGGDPIAGDISFTAIPLMFGALDAVLAPGAWVYACGGQSNISLYSRMFELHFRQLPRMIIWDKGRTAILRRNGYHSCYELIFFAFREGGGGRWFSGRTSEDADDIWRVPVDGDADRVHVTQKPVELPARAIRNTCPPGGLVFEPFAGSGSTLIACEQAGRRCAAIELDPTYCDVIVRRWEQFTGRQAEIERCEEAA